MTDNRPLLPGLIHSLASVAPGAARLIRAPIRYGHHAAAVFVRYASGRVSAGFAGDPKRGSMLRRSMAQADEDETIK